jgi:hypothetical protein
MVTQTATDRGALFDPVFIVGSPRSGTTLLATLVDRHSRIAIPPETHFFGHFRRWIGQEFGALPHHTLVDEFLKNRRALDMKLDREAILSRFSRYPADLPHLLRAALEEYAARRAKPRAGEKTPGHLEFVPLILQWFPRARVVCIVRDGRAAVLSAMKLGWHGGDIVALSLLWRRYARRMLEYEQRYPESFLRVHYEDLVRNATRVLVNVDAFIGLQFEPSQFDASMGSSLIPQWETKWKAKSAAQLDPERLEAWRNEIRDEEMWLMNLLIGKYLSLLNYPDSAVSRRVSPRLLRYVVGRLALAVRAYPPVKAQLRRLGVRRGDRARSGPGGRSRQDR